MEEPRLEGLFHVFVTRGGGDYTVLYKKKLVLERITSNLNRSNKNALDRITRVVKLESSGEILGVY